MPYFAIEDFKAGLDVRRSRFTSVAGTLQKLVNAHISRGGDVEKRKAFVRKGALPEGTFGLAADIDGLVTFGSNATPTGLPPEVRYQRLQAPSGAAMTGVDAWALFGGRVYVAARFDDGEQWHFYDGELVGDWGGGTVHAYMADNSGIAESLADLINGGGIYDAEVDGDVITVTGPEGVDFATGSASRNVDGGVDDQQLVISTTQLAVERIEEAAATASFAVAAGREGDGNEITQVRALAKGGAVDLLAEPVPFTTNAKVTAAEVAAAINSNFPNHGYVASAELGIVKLRAPEGQGRSANGRVIEVEASGEVALYDGKFSLTAGTEGAENQVIHVRVNGRAVMENPVDWSTSNSHTAELVAAAIRDYASDPKMLAVAIGETVYLSPKVIRSDDPSSTTIEVSLAGDVGSDAGAPPPEGPPGGGGGYSPPRDGHDSPVYQVR